MITTALTSPLPDAATRDAFLTEIPSETTYAERLLLYTWFKDHWDGQGTVIEIGPFLGGTTRAIAWGMAHNVNLSADAALHTFDRFGPYYTPESLRRTIEPMVARGIFTAAEAEHLCNVGGFLALFEAIHRPHNYYALLRIHDSPLPDLPGEVDRARALADFTQPDELGALFIDGCKSWASTHYAMKCLLPCTRVGAPVIFQDFGWYTCFWISSVVHALGDALTWETRANSTYVFRLARRISAEEVAARFPKTPAELGAKFFQQAATALFERCHGQGDLRGELIARLHHTAALVTLGRRAEAAQVLQSIHVPTYREHADMIRGCLNSPTYLPGGRPLRWK